MSKFPRPQNSKPRRAEALVKGKEYKLSFIAREKSKFPSRTNEEVYKLIAVYKDFGMLFHTFLPYEYDTKTEENVADYNNKIAANKNLRLVYYGKISQCLQIDILEDGEEVNAEKLQGVALIEQTEAQSRSGSVPKRKSSDDDDGNGSSPKKSA